MVSGPVRNNRYSRPIAALPNKLLARSLSVPTFFTLYTMRICRWSCRFSPTPGRSCSTGMPCSLQQRAGTDAGELQDLRRADRARGEDHFALCLGELVAARTRAELDAGGALDACPVLQAHALHVRMGHHREVRALHHGPQQRLGGAPAHAALLVHVEIGVAEIVAAVEFLDLRDAAFGRGVAPRVEDLPVHAPLLHAQLAAAAVELVCAVRSSPRCA